MGEKLGQSLFIDNRGGGASIIGTQAIATAAPDGYTIGVVDSAFTINPSLFGNKLPYDTKKNFTPVSLLARTSLLLVVSESLPVNNVKELIALAKSKPGTLSMATAGLGTAVHLGCEQFRQEAGIDVVPVPYRGGGPSIIDLLGGKVDFTFSTIPDRSRACSRRQAESVGKYDGTDRATARRARHGGGRSADGGRRARLWNCGTCQSAGSDRHSTRHGRTGRS